MLAEDVGFTQGVVVSNWISRNDFEFGDLVNGQIYYYRVRAMNMYGPVSDWSNVVFSVQDAEAPWSDVVNVEIEDDVFLVKMNSFDAGSGVDFLRIYASVDGGQWQEVSVTSVVEVTVVLQRLLDVGLFQSVLEAGEYTVCFAAQAVDNVGNEEIFDPATGEDQCVVWTVDEEIIIGPEGPIDEIEEIVPDDIAISLDDFWGGLWDLIEFNRDGYTLVTLAGMSTFVSGIVAMLIALNVSIGDAFLMIMESISVLLGFFGFGKSRRPWGIVYDSVTKEPVARAVVRMFSGRELVQTAVTSFKGIFNFRAMRGVYTVTVSRRDYKFPSEIVKGNVDGMRRNIYRGGEYEITADEADVELNLPIDPIMVSDTRRLASQAEYYFKAAIALFSPLIPMFSALFSALCYIILGQALFLVIFVFNVLLALFIVYVRFIKYPRMGSVVDEGGNPIPGIRIGIFESTYGRQVDERVTDENGKYRFIVPGGDYHIKSLDQRYLIAKQGKYDGLTVGKKSKDDIIISDRVVLRRIRSSRKSSE
jgi:hypothetical protein